jgi:glycosyltransferase involved in cell wall biosynthesis
MKMSASCSVIIPTILRSSLQRTIDSVLSQGLCPEEVEIIVVNDSGDSLGEAEWQYHDSVRVITTNKVNYIIARNVGAAEAKNNYLIFMDDDDWFLSGGLRHLLDLANKNPGYALIYGGAEFIDGNGDPLGSLNLQKSGNCFAQIFGKAWIQVGSALVKREAFWRVGGFDPSLKSGEEFDLWLRLGATDDFLSTSRNVNVILRGVGWLTTVDYRKVLDNTNRVYDKALDISGSFSRLQTSAHQPYWQGRVWRSYLGNALWNLRQKRGIKCIDRCGWWMIWLLTHLPGLLRKEFWQGVRDHIPPCSIKAIKVIR